MLLVYLSVYVYFTCDVIAFVNAVCWNGFVSTQIYTKLLEVYTMLVFIRYNLCASSLWSRFQSIRHRSALEYYTVLEQFLFCCVAFSSRFLFSHLNHRHSILPPASLLWIMQEGRKPHSHCMLVARRMVHIGECFPSDSNSIVVRERIDFDCDKKREKWQKLQHLPTPSIAMETMQCAVKGSINWILGLYRIMGNGERNVSVCVCVCIVSNLYTLYSNSVLYCDAHSHIFE